MAARVLVVEDDDGLRQAIAASLRSAGLTVDVAAGLPDADRLLTENTYDCVVLDRSLPGSGVRDYVRTRRAAGWTAPVLFLSAQDMLTDRASALEDEIDDYLVKPFAPSEVAARVVGLVRRSTDPEPSVLTVGHLEIDRARREVRRRGVPLKLTSRQFTILALLAERQGRPVSRTELLDRAWDADAAPSNVVDLEIRRLRQRLGSPEVLYSVRGRGFRLLPDGELPGRTPPPDEPVATTYAVSIYLGDESAHREVQAAVEELIRAVGWEIAERDDPVLGSWFRRMVARIGGIASTPLAREAAATAAHAVESRAVLAHDAAVTATLMQNLGPVLDSLQSTKDAVIRVGALLIVKVDWVVAVHQLTAAQQLTLDHHPHLLTSPNHILQALNLDTPAPIPRNPLRP